jgi:hypothetical protein
MTRLRGDLRENAPTKLPSNIEMEINLLICALNSSIDNPISDS